MSEETEDPPECAHALGHHWVGGRVEEIEDGIKVVSRQCRNCGYEQAIPEENQMKITRGDG